MRIIDLSSPVDASAWEPNPVVHETMSHAEGAEHMAAEMREHLGIDFDPSALPGGELLSLGTLTLTTHTGTHVDAPAHYGSAAAYGRPRTIDEMPLDWFVRPGIVLDLTGEPVGALGAGALERAFEKAGRGPDPMDIVLLHTGADRHAGTPEYFTSFSGLDRKATETLLDLGVRVIGTDAFSLDAPFGDMIERFHATGDRDVLWPAHMLGREREYCQIERLANLGELDPRGRFTVVCLPVRIAGGDAGWSRTVALLDGD
ncbi:MULTISPECIES: cyclase family protein [unclassified Nocardiopsis]|uniref:cyclase family protein n=1 Tax=Nocardiopsis TaxID=2013 RepID=UPI00387AEAA3